MLVLASSVIYPFQLEAMRWNSTLASAIRDSRVMLKGDGGSGVFRGLSDPFENKVCS